MTNNQRPVWKRLFFWLLGINAFIVILITVLVFWPVSAQETPDGSGQETKQQSEFVVRTTKEKLDELVNAYLDELLGDSEHEYSVSFGEDVKLTGELPVFQTTVPLQIHLDPVVQENGDIVLKQESISIGKLTLPNKKILEYLDKYLPIPEWITVNPADEEIYVAVTEMDIKSNFNISVKKFDLEADDIAFNIEVPYRTLGIDAMEKEL